MLILIYQRSKLKQSIVAEPPTGTLLKSFTAYAKVGERLSATASANTIQTFST
jgi:hypothetical protein